MAHRPAGRPPEPVTEVVRSLGVQLAWGSSQVWPDIAWRSRAVRAKIRIQALLVGSLNGWTKFLDPNSSNSPINPVKNPTPEQLALMTELLDQMQAWQQNVPLNGGIICQWATSTHDQFHAKYPDFDGGSPGAGDWANIVGDLLRQTGTNCSGYTF